MTNTADSGPGSLRQAIIDANVGTEAANIVFQIPSNDSGFVDVDSTLPGGDAAPDVFRIQPLTQLPAINNAGGHAITIAGTSQSSFGGDTNPLGPEIWLDGSLAGTSADGLFIQSDNVSLVGLNVANFSGDGIDVRGDGVHLYGNVIGLDATGTVAAANSGHGVLVRDSVGVIIGGSELGQRNVISGNQGHGIAVTNSTGTVIAGNRIGTSGDGSSEIGNGTATFNGDGINLSNAQGITIGGPQAADGNLISGNEGSGVFLQFEFNSDVTIQNNRIGTNSVGSVSLGRQENGVRADAGAGVHIVGNHLSGHQEAGIGAANLSNSAILGNLIGLNRIGDAALGNGRDGVALINSLGIEISDNVLSGNAAHGLRVVGSRNVLIDTNTIGLNAVGNAPIGNGDRGIDLFQVHDHMVTNNLVSGNVGTGIFINLAGATGRLQQWPIADGGNDHWYWMTPVRDHWEAHQVQAESLGGNLVTINDTAENTFLTSFINDSPDTPGAWIGLNDFVTEGDYVWASGETSVFTNWHEGQPNGVANEDGVVLWENANWYDEPNHNKHRAIIEFTSMPDAELLQTLYGSVAITRNIVGLEQDGVTIAGNGRHGIDVLASNHVMIGGATVAEGNLISGNEGHGVTIREGATRITVTRNSIHSNGALGIDLEEDGVTLNDASDADEGSNGRQNFPTLRLDPEAEVPSAVVELNSEPSSDFVIELFGTDVREKNGTEGKAFVLARSTTTDANGNASIRIPVSELGNVKILTATATDSQGQTSEFTPLGLLLNATAYLGELSEGNADLWTTFGSPGDVHSIVNSTEHVTAGSRSLRFMTTGGFDTGVAFPATQDARWDLTRLTHFSFDTFSDNPNSLGFQGAQPIVIFNAPGGSVRYRPTFTLTPRQGPQSYEIPLAGSSRWIREVIGNPDLTQVHDFEIHQDTWDFGFTLWYDNVYLYEQRIEISSAGQPLQNAVSLGAGNPGDVRSRTVTISNTSNRPIVFQPLASRNDFVWTQNFGINQSLAAGESYDLTLTHTSAVAGTFLESITISSDADPTPHDDLHVGATYVEGLRLVQDINPGLQSTFANTMAVLGDELIFIGSDSESSPMLFATNGTEAGTRVITELPGERDFEIQFQSFANVLVFTVETDAGDNEWWRTDGTSQGTYAWFRQGDVSRYADVDLLSESSVTQDIFYFAGSDGANGQELWKTNGTFAGTQLVADINTDPVGTSSFGDELGGSRPSGFVDFAGYTYFAAFPSNEVITSFFARNLYRTDGTPEGTESVLSILNGTEIGNLGISPQYAIVGERLVISVTDDEGTSFDLWSWDGVPGTAQLLASYSGAGLDFPTLLKSSTDSLLFVATDASEQEGLWSTDGTNSGTRLVTSLDNGDDNHFVDLPSAIAGDLTYFYATSEVTGLEIWFSDGTQEGTRNLIDLRPGSNGSEIGGKGIARLGNTLYFTGDDGTTGSELWAYQLFNQELTLSTDTNSIAENGSTLVTVTRSGLTDRELVVNVSVDDASEVSVPVSVTIPAGQSAATFAISGQRDFLLDGTQTVFITATATGFAEAMVQLDVTDVETAQASLLAVSHGSETIQTDGRFEVRLSQAAEFDIDIPYTWSGSAQSGTDYNVLSGTARIIAGTTTTMVPVTIVNDEFAEYTEALRLTLGNPNVAGLSLDTNATSAQILILDNDFAGIAVSTRAVTVSETGTSTTIGVTLTSKPESPVRVLVGYSDSTEITAFGPGGSTFLTFDSSNWDVQQTVTVTGVDDALADGSQRSTVMLNVDLSNSPPPLYRVVAPVLIETTTLDNEPPAALATVDSVVTFNRDAAAERNLSPQKNGQRSIIRQIEVVLDGNVAVSSGAVSNGGFVLTNTGTGATIGLNVASRIFGSGKTRIVLTFTSGTEASGSLLDGHYQFAIDGSVLGIDANRSGSVGGTHTTIFHRLFGDSDGDRDVDGIDFGRYRLAAYATPARPSVYSSVFDFDNDGGILNDLDDYFALLGRLGRRI